MKVKFLTLIISGLVLAACNGQPSSSNGGATQNASAPVTASATTQAETASVPVAAANELKSKDGKITIAIAGGFDDKSGDASLLPENITAEELLMLQHNAENNTSIYAIQSGEISDVKAYFAKLEQAIKNDKSLKNTNVNVSDDKLTYHFSQSDESGEITLNESCVVAVADKKVHNVCASSPDLDLAALDDIIGKVQIAE